MRAGSLKAGPQYETGNARFADAEMEDPEGQEAERRTRLAELQRLEGFGLELARQRDTWIAARRSSGWDKRVQEDLDQYHARETGLGTPEAAANMMNSVEQGFPVTQNQSRALRSTVYIGLTRQKSNAAEARLSDILLPTDEKNWGILPTPIPELAEMLLNSEQATYADLVRAMGAGPEGLEAPDEPMTLNAVGPDGKVGPQKVMKKDIALAAETVARQRCKAMEKEIDDQLNECHYNSVQRKVIHDAAVMGTGVLKGPIVTNRTRNSWQQIDGNVYGLVTVSEDEPASFHVDPRFVWEDPDCGDDIQNGAGIYELEQMTKKQVRALAKQPGYILENLQQVLEEGPTRCPELVTNSIQLNRELYKKSTYDVWHYTGEFNPQHLRDAGVDLPEDFSELDAVSGCVVMINNTIVKAYLNPIETGELPYDFYPWEKITDSPRGFSVPYLMRAPQKVINAAWRMMLDNAAVCAGPQIVVKKDKVTPEDGNWNIYSRKVWIFTGGPNERADDAFTMKEISMHQAELQAIISLGMQLADAETSTPLIAQGEQGDAPDTVGGMQMLMNSANVVLRRLVKQYDDYVTKRHIRRYYDYNMAYSEEEGIKGDMQIDARGSSALLVRDIQNQAFTNLLAAAANPVFAPFIDPKKLFEKALAAQHVQPQDIMKSDSQMKEEAEAAAKNPQPQDPRIQAAMINAKARLDEANARAAGEQSELKLRDKIAEQNFAAQIEKLALERELALLKYATDQKLTIEEAKVQLAIAAMGYRQKSEQLQTEAQLRINTGAGV